MKSISTKMPNLKGKELVTKFKDLGWQEVNHEGSHVIMRKVTKKIPIPCSTKPIATGTLRSILRHSGVSIVELNAV
jgi:predicted RNA binding protein YcfA (HicA-like mRNA interferase family)